MGAGRAACPKASAGFTVGATPTSYRQSPAFRYPALCASASLLNTTRFRPLMRPAFGQFGR